MTYRLVLLAVTLVVSACRDAPPPAWSGYAEGDYVHVAAPLAGTLQAFEVRRGSSVKRGEPLFRLDAASEQAARDEAAARLQGAEAQANDAAKGRRADELAVVQAQLARARAQAELAAVELARQSELLAQGFVAQARVDDARTAFRQARQGVTELEAALRVARLPARTDAQAAALASAVAASQALRQTEIQAQRKQQSAPVDGQVADVYFRVGEFVGAGQPVLSLLAPEAIKVRFFVPENALASLAAGQTVSLQCDGCGLPIAARIDFIASQAEYTPPVIYSNAQRARLVFLVEARPALADARRLHPGQPVDVRLQAAPAP